MDVERDLINIWCNGSTVVFGATRPSSNLGMFTIIMSSMTQRQL